MIYPIRVQTNISIEEEHVDSNIQKRKFKRKTKVQQLGRKTVVHVNEWKYNKRKLCNAARETSIS